MDTKYNPQEIEPKIYKMWETSNAFSPENANTTRTKKTFSVLMPPPNANAPLHCGHATYAIQDIMARFKRMQGYKTLYLPGTDHAGFETQVVYERHLKKEGKSRFDFDRETLYQKVLDFVNENSTMAITQLKQLGMSADWNRTVFMLDNFVIKTVYDTFEKMHKEGLIYRDLYLVNYSPHHGTTFSNLETIHIETQTDLYYIKYPIKNSNDFITVATVRPETVYADVAIAVNPKDKRYKKLIGKTVINPLNNRELPIIADAAVNIDFGTGALKITPGHDFTDFEIGKRHDLPMISVIDLEGKMTKEAADVAGMKVPAAREKAIEILTQKSLVDKVDSTYTHNLLVDYKDQKPIEPLLLPNWFIKMAPLVKEARKVIKNNTVKFNRDMWKKEALRWLDNTPDWPISRQTVFGIRIPIWYSTKENPDLFVVFLDASGNVHEGKIEEVVKNFNLQTIKKGLQKVIASEKTTYTLSVESPGREYLPETDTFDTWFSSGQWPLTTLKYPNGQDFKEFFPTTFLDSMWDILPFWIIRMIMFSLYLTKQTPFKNVYIHGVITDSKGQKMSKSKGNAINPLDFVEKYGADALRMGLTVGGNTAAKNTALSENNVKAYRNFANKIWNMARFILLMMKQSDQEIPCYSAELESNLQEEDKELLKKTNDLVTKVTKGLEKYRFKDAGEEIYQFMWHELADIYIEKVKTREDKLIALSILRHVFLTCLKLLHPFMPFVTEEIWANIPKEESYPLIITSWPNSN